MFDATAPRALTTRRTELVAPADHALPMGFSCYVANVGVKDHTEDFVVVAAAQTCAAAGVFTRVDSRDRV